MAIAIIPARGGSKRIPRKNIKNFFGEPLISYSINAAKAANIFSKIFVSTEDSEIKEISLSYGVEVLDRPLELSDDFTGTKPIIQDAIKTLELADDCNLCCIYATAPLLQPETLIQAYDMLQANPNKHIFAASSFSTPPQRGFLLDKAGLAFYLAPEFENTRSQDLPKIYFDAGMFYFSKVSVWNKKDIFRLPLILPETKIQDIDNLTDWQIAELKYNLIMQEKQNSNNSDSQTKSKT